MWDALGEQLKLYLRDEMGNGRRGGTRKSHLELLSANVSGS